MVRMPLGLNVYTASGLAMVLAGGLTWPYAATASAPASETGWAIRAGMMLVPAGLVIYWTWNNLLSVAQQGFIMKRAGVPFELWDNLAKTFKRKTA